MSAFNPYSKEELDQVGGGSPDEINKDGLYRMKCLSAFDSYKVNPDDKDDPERGRRISLRVKVLDVVRDVRGDIKESDADLADREDQIGNVANVSVWLDRGGNASKLEGNMRLLASVAGSPDDDQPDEGLLQKHQDGTNETGQPVYEMGPVADEVHINCESLVGRDFIAVLQNTEGYPTFFPWYVVQIPDDEQTPFKYPNSDEKAVQTSGTLFSGEDTASQRMKKVFDENDSGGGDTDYEKQTTVTEPDDDLPF